MASVKKVMAFIKRESLNDRIARAIVVAKQATDFSKQSVLNQIKNHAISQELIHHTPSKFLTGRKTATLFGFLGFNAGTDPVGKLLGFLNAFWDVKPTTKWTFFGFRVNTKLRLPTRAEMKAAGLTLPWQESLVWPYAIESGISNLPYFLNVPRGRSGEGLQAKGKTVDASFDGVDYITEIFRNNKNVFRSRNFKL